MVPHLPVTRSPARPLSAAPALASRFRRATAAFLLGTTILSGAAAVVPSAAAAAPVTVPAVSQELPGSFADLVDRVMPAVVNVSTVQGGNAAPEQRGMPGMPEFPPGSPFEEFFRQFQEQQRGARPRAERQQAQGSGFIIDAAGYVVTNNHVIDGADEISVTLHDGSRLDAKLVGRDPKTDLALLKVDAGKPLAYLEFGDSDTARVGDWVIAIGNPFGLGGTVTSGIVSARGRDIQAGPYDDFLQLDASINRGNSGGPTFDVHGRVIGINTAIFSPSGGSVGIGFAIPSTLARSVVAQLKDFGRTRRGWLGVRIQGVTPEIAESLGLRSATGALVASVTPNGPAAEAGIQAGDVILTFDGKEVNEMRRLPRVVAETGVEEQVPVKLWRRGQEQTVRVKVGELEAAALQRYPRAVSLEKRFEDLLPEVTLGVDANGFAQVAAAGLTPRPVPTVGLDHLHDVQKVSVPGQARRMASLLSAAPGTWLTFGELTADCENVLEIVGSFLGLLELFREQAITFEQPEALGDLAVMWTGERGADDLRIDKAEDYG